LWKVVKSDELDLWRSIGGLAMAAHRLRARLATTEEGGLVARFRDPSRVTFAGFVSVGKNYDS
jgi:hypothetical protein